jgi:glycosyltransferase involved in cell wall biosynthesis
MSLLESSVEKTVVSAPRVSIVMPVYNGAEFLEECLASVAAQTYQSWEVFIVNNCSTDGTAKIADTFAARDPRFRPIHCSEFVSKTENYNRAIAHASKNAEFIKLLEADNFLLPESIAQAVQLADSDPEIGIVSTYYNQGHMLLGGGVDPKHSVIPGNEVRRHHLLKEVYYFGVPSTLLFRAKALREVHPFFRAEVFFDDVDLCFRVLEKWKFGIVHQVLAYVRDDNHGLYSVIRAFDDVVACQYALVVLFGKDVLTTEELARATAKRKKVYFDNIGRAVVGGRSREYWEFHRGVFLLLGKKLGFRTLVGPALLSILDMVFNPKTTIERTLAHRFGYRHSAAKPARLSSSKN